MVGPIFAVSRFSEFLPGIVYNLSGAAQQVLGSAAVGYTAQHNGRAGVFLTNTGTDTAYLWTDNTVSATKAVLAIPAGTSQFVAADGSAILWGIGAGELNVTGVR